MKVELEVTKTQDMNEGGERRVRVELEGSVEPDPIEGCRSGCYTLDGRFPDYRRAIKVSIHLTTNSDGLEKLKYGDKLTVELPGLDPDLKTPGRLDPIRLKEMQDDPERRKYLGPG